MDFVPGALVAGRYRLKQLVGSGGMGEVWAGEDVKNGGKVAVKHLLPAAAKHHEVVARFKREAFLLGKIESQYVSRVVDFFDDETFGLVLVMEFIEGPSLAHILEQRTLTVEEAVDLSVDLLRALSQLHASKIVHRDLKPGNIIMRKMPHGRNQATVVDFGISRLLADKGDNEVTGITRANIALGTVEYMAPEQILNSRDVTPVTDLYAVGIILFRAIKGHHAFGDRRGEELARAKLIEDAPALETGRSDDLARGLAAVVARALKKKPAHRFASADEMLAAVEGLQRLAHSALDLDDATTDSGETAVKPSPLAAHEDDDGPGTLAMVSPLAGGARAPSRGGTGMLQAPAPAAGAKPSPPRVVAPAASAPAAPARASAPAGPAVAPRASGLDWSSARDEAQRAASVRASLPSISESQPRASLPSISESQPRASLPSISESQPRASLPSIPDAPRSGSEREGAPSPRASLSSLADVPPPPPPRSELTMERPGFGSKGTVALAILTSFAVGAAVGLIVAPTSAPAGKSEACPACASASPSQTCAPSAAATATAASAAATASEAPSAVTSAPTSAPASATAKPTLTGKLSSLPVAPPPPPPPPPKPTAVPTFDGLGEDDPPPPPKTAAPPPPSIPAPEL